MPTNPKHCYADDNTPQNTQFLQNNLANIDSSINLDINRFKKWDNFNGGKTQYCLISIRVSFDSILWQNINVGCHFRIWSFLKWPYYFRTKSYIMSWLSFGDQTFFHAHSTFYPIPGSNSLLSRIWLTSLQRSLQAFLCYLGCNS